MFRLTPLLAALLVGCGIPDETLMSELEEGDLESLCAELADEDRSVTCTYDGFEFTVDVSGSEEECVSDNDVSAYEGCDVTVGDVRACDEAWDTLSEEEICALETGFPEACDPILECVFSF